MYPPVKYILPANPVAYYLFNGNANDLSGNGHNGTVTGATLTTNQFGAISSAYTYNSAQYITLDNNFNESTLSFNFWLKKPVGSGQYTAFKFDATGGLYFGSYFNKVFIGRVGSGYDYLSSVAEITDNVWQFVTIQINAAKNYEIYIDKVLKYSGTLSNLGAKTDTLTINKTAAYPDATIIDDVYIYNRFLSVEEITQLYHYTESENPKTTAYKAVVTITELHRQYIDKWFNMMDLYKITSQATACYLLYGTTYDSQKYNLFNPVDSDGAYRLTDVGSITRDNIGSVSAGGYIDTHININTLSATDLSIALSSMTDSISGVGDVGNYQDATHKCYLSAKDAANSYCKAALLTDGSTTIFAEYISTGLYTAWKNGTTTTIYKNGVVEMGANLTSQAVFSANILIHAVSDGIGGFTYSDRKLSFVWIGKKFTNNLHVFYFQKFTNELLSVLNKTNGIINPEIELGGAIPDKRIKIQYDANIWYSVYLPKNYSSTGTPHKVIFDIPGNIFLGHTGLPNDPMLGFGLTKGNFIVVQVPCINTAGTAMLNSWWGNGNPTDDPSATVTLWQNILTQVLSTYNADSNNVSLCGFSRGAIGVHYIGCWNDTIAALWKCYIPHSHMDGGTYTPTGADIRIDRVGTKKTIVVYGSTDSGKANSQTGEGILTSLGKTFSDYEIPGLFHRIEWTLLKNDPYINAIRNEINLI